MRDKAYYLKILRSPHYAHISVTLAAAMVYAARHGVCDLKHRRTSEFVAIVQELRVKYGEALSIEKAGAEMDAAINGKPMEKMP